MTGKTDKSSGGCVWGFGILWQHDARFVCVCGGRVLMVARDVL